MKVNETNLDAVCVDVTSTNEMARLGMLVGAPLAAATVLIYVSMTWREFVPVTLGVFAVIPLLVARFGCRLSE